MKTLPLPPPLLPIVLLLAFGIGESRAYPPAPHHVVFGTIRDELGRPLNSIRAEVLFEAASGTVVSTRINPVLGGGVNYSLTIPMDAGLTMDLYRPTALRPFVPFLIRVRIGTAQFVPIEMTGDYATLGLPGGRTRLDLTLGEDTDGDGLPDAWERALIAQLGGGLTLADIRPDDDLDGDGLTNRMEYLAGTHAYDGEHTLSLKVAGAVEGRVMLEFLGLSGRTYAVEIGNSVGEWRTGRFLEVRSGAMMAEYMATDLRNVQVEVELPSADSGAHFFRLRVQ
ncbi:MAG: hypothetical protein KF833_11205 [Verrucomicrobiae bacterium]|nr:hypothetical protein [Verrucomicrobiae bacterium]